MEATTYVPTFNKENAAFYGKLGGLKSGEARRAVKETIKEILREPIPEGPDLKLEARKAKIAVDIDKCDALIAACSEPDIYVKLVAAKATLWKLLFPQPKASRQRSNFTPAEPDHPGNPV